MTGLEKIMKAIDEEAQVSADAIIAEAKHEAEEILAAANNEAAAICKQIAEKAEADGKDIISRAKSSAALFERKLLLNTKQEIINDMIAKARKQLISLSDSEYTEMILSMVRKYAYRKEGKILFSKSDRKRLTSDFADRLNSSLAQKPGASLIIAEQEPPFTGGFLLVYGDIEENCSFDALFAERKDILQDKVNSLLFE